MCNLTDTIVTTVIGGNAAVLLPAVLEKIDPVVDFIDAFGI
jgi:hypothetical protein